MTNQTKGLLVLLAIVFLIAGWAIYSWRTSQADLEKAQANQKANDAIISIQQQTIAQKDADIKARDKAQASTDAELARLRAEITSTRTALAALPKVITLPAPVTENANGSATIPAPSVIPLTQRLVDCQRFEGDLGVCLKDKTDREAQMAAAEKKIQALAQERDNWKAAAKGGTFWKRLERGLTTAGCGAGGAALGGMKGPAPAAIGAAVASTLCSIFVK